MSECIGVAHAGLHEGRFRALGGSTIGWAGQALPLFEGDFEHRDWLPGTGWPLQWKDLQPYYRRAETVLDLPHVTYAFDNTTERGRRLSGYDRSKIVPYFSQISKLPDMWKLHGRTLRRQDNITIITHANAIAITSNESASSVREVHARSLEGREIRVRANTFVLCCGGIDTPRLLLASTSVEPWGIGNSRDVVGRFFQDHIAVDIPIEPNNQRLFGAWHDSYTVAGHSRIVKLVAAEQVQRKLKMLHVGSEITYPFLILEPLPTIKRILRSKAPNAILQASHHLRTNLREIMSTATRRYIYKVPPWVGASAPHLSVYCEQEPNPISRVTLSTRRDRIGVPRAVLDWKVGELQRRSIEAFVGILASEWRRLGLVTDNWNWLELLEHDVRREREPLDQYHHMGTTRMGGDPKSSVVDSDCLVHGYDNLYIGSSSVFPSGGFSNPTLTIIALCLRIADHIKHRAR